jgi:hypothetical protein
MLELTMKKQLLTNQFHVFHHQQFYLLTVQVLDKFQFQLDKDGGSLSVCQILINGLRIIMRYAVKILKFNQDLTNSLLSVNHTMQEVCQESKVIHFSYTFPPQKNHIIYLYGPSPFTTTADFIGSTFIFFRVPFTNQ